MKNIFLPFLIIALGCSNGSDPIQRVLNSDSFLEEIAENPKYEVRIAYTQIDRDSVQIPSFKTFYFKVDSNSYYYPASTVKLPASLLALEKINRINIPGLSKNSRLEIDSAHSRQIPLKVDSTAADRNPNIAHFIKKILIVSDNDAYNRLYEFLGQDGLNEMLRDKGYSSTRIIHRLSLLRSPEENRVSNPFRFYNEDTIVYEQPLSTSTGKFSPPDQIFRGFGYIKEQETGDTLINEPFEFTYKNFFPIQEQHLLMKALIFPEQFPEHSFNLSKEDYKFLYHYMGVLPGESDITTYQNPDEYWNSYAKFFMYGSDPSATIPSNIRILNKIGQAYGYLLDNAYIVDFDNGIEFILSAVVHVNENQIYNDGNYEYDSIGLPFLRKLGMEFYKLEMDRKKKIVPDLYSIEELFPRR